MTRAARLAFRSMTQPLAEGRLQWETDGRNWPNREASRFVKAGGLTWHVQIMGQGPVIFLVHGTGASTHSWRALAPLLSRHFTVVAPDLPGHGFTEKPPSSRLALPAMAEALSLLLDTLGVVPVVAAGHSAGAAILARMCLDGKIAPDVLFSLNGALLPLSGVPFHLFSPVAKMMAAMRPLPAFFAGLAGNQGVIERLIGNTGSTLDADGLAQYRMLFRSPGHIAAVLGMMANWRLEALARDLPRLKTPLVQIVGENDRTIPPADAARVKALLPDAAILTLPGLGHLAHEEQPEQVAGMIESYAAAPRKRNRR